MAKKQTDYFRKNLATIVEEEGYGAVKRLSDYLEYHRVTVSKKIHGDDPIGLEEAEKIAHFYGYSLSEMLVSPSKFRKFLAAS